MLQLFNHLFLIGGYLIEMDNIYYYLMSIPFIHLFFYQMYIFKSKDPSTCLRAFKSNNTLGLIIFLNILVTKL